MNADRLLALYEKVAEAPDAVARLRRFVLDLAVRGKLVTQDAGDEPASDLLKRIATEKARLVKAGEIRRPKPAAPIDPAELPISVPSHWAWLRLRDIGMLSGGMTPSKNQPDYWDGDVVWLSPKDIKTDEVSDSELKITSKGLDETRLELFPEGSLFIVARSGILKRTFPVAINRVRAASNQDLKVLVPYLKGQERYLQIMFRGMTDFLLTQLVKQGTTVQSLKYAEFEVQPFPLPPLAEQRRIVAKVEELMALLDRLEAARTAREATRDRLTAASLTRLTAPDTNPAEFPSRARFALAALPALTTRPDQIKSLRQTILNLAVRGKLVEHDPADEPASELLKRAAKDIAQYSRANGVRGMNVEKILAEDRPFALPPRWAWSRLASLCRVVTDGDHQPPPRSAEGVAFLTIGNVTTGRLSFAGCRRVPPAYFNNLPAYRRPAVGDLLYTVVGATFGRPVQVDAEEPFCVQRHIAILKPSNEISVAFLHRVLASPFVYEQAAEATTGAAQPTIALKPLRNFLIPLPPLEEQHRILAKVDALMVLCDRLEVALATADETRCHLLEALHAEAHLLVGSRDLEAAE